MNKPLRETLSVSSTVKSQLTSEHPPVVQFTLFNKTNSEMNLLPYGSGQALEKLANYKSNAGKYELIPFPVNPEHMTIAVDLPNDASSTECWRLPDDIEPLVEDSRFKLTLSSGEEYKKSHYLFYEGPSETCLESHTYEMATPMFINGPKRSQSEVHLHSQLSVAKNKQISSSAHLEPYDT